MKEPVSLQKKMLWYKNKRFLTVLLGLFFIALMVFSVVDLSLRSTEESVKYKGLTFKSTSQGWVTYLDNGQQLIFASDPSKFSSETFPDISVLNAFQKVYISVTPTTQEYKAMAELQRTFPLVPRTVVACTEDNSGCENMPLKTCEDASDTAAVLLLQESNDTVVSWENNCFRVQGKDLLTLIDHLVVEHYA